MTSRKRSPARRRSPGKAESRGARNIRWIEAHCRIPEGRFVGQPVRLREWQRADIRKIYDNPAGTRRAIISFGRKNAKTTLAAFLLLLHTCGPEAVPNSQLNSAAQSKDQAAVLFKLAAKIVRMSPTLKPVLVIRDTVKELACPELGTLYKALSAEVATAYGLSPVFIVHDELGQARGPTSGLYDALETAVAAHDAPLSIIISTQAPTEADLLSVLIDDALAGNDPRVVLSLYTADVNIDPFSEEAIRQANPAFGDFQNAEEVLAMAEDARRMPPREAEYRNLVLNQRVEASSPFVSAGVWQSCAGAVAEDFTDLPVYGGLDLSEVNDLTALVLIAPVDQVWHVRPTFWLPAEGLRERSRKDRVPYDEWASRGFLETTPGRSIEYEFIAEYLRGLFDKLDIRKIAFDRWNWKHLKAWLLKAGFDEDQLDQHFVEFGQGYQSMSPALRDLESALLNGKIAHGGHPVLNMCARNAVVQKDPAGNRKLTKAKSRGRIDGMLGLSMAMSVAASDFEEAAEPFVMWA
jgi:phage terminase large subunit-like protein